jgi:DNA-binding NtrC family response regulator
MKHDLRVFVVDDMPLIAYTVSSVLRDEGHSAIPYIDPVAALQDARSFRPDVLISDVDMPNLGGIDLAIQVLGFCPNCKVILMTGHKGSATSVDEARAKGFHFALFEKPLSARILLEELEIFRVERQSPLCGQLERVGTR